MKTILTAILLLASLTANAGRFYSRTYYYYGPRDDSGGWGLLILVGLAIVLIVMALITQGLLKKADQIDKLIKKNEDNRTIRAISTIAIPILFFGAILGIMMLLNSLPTEPKKTESKSEMTPEDIQTIME